MLARFLKRPTTDSHADAPLTLKVRAAGTPRISPLAIVDPKAQIGEDCEIGPFCTVGPNVVLGPGCRLISHVVVTGHTTIGCNNTFHPFSVIGDEPQDKKYCGEITYLEIGDENTFREHVTIHVGTGVGGGYTRVGNKNLLMVNVHIGHDCQVADNTIMANNVMLAGHVVIGNNVVISGAAASHHFVTFGDYSFIAGVSRIHHDVPPFVKVSDNDKIRAVNSEGLKRAGFSADDIEQIEEAGKKLFFAREKPMASVLRDFEADPNVHPRVKELCEFLRRRNRGKHGRYLESLRPSKNTAKQNAATPTND